MSTNQKLPADEFDRLLACDVRAELAWRIRGERRELTLPQARRLEARLNELRPSDRPFRMAVLHTYTSDLLDPWLSFEYALQDLAVDIYHAPYGVLRQEASPDSGLARHAPELTVLLLQKEDLHPALSRPLAGLDEQGREAVRSQALSDLLELVTSVRRTVGGTIAVTFLPAMTGPGLGLYDAHSDRSESGWWASFKSQVAHQMRERVQGALLLDLDDLVAQFGREGTFDPRLWYSSRFPFTARAARELSRRLAALGAVLRHPRAKVIALDADNTLWGGVIGEEGMQGIALGPDYPGNAYAAFQRRLLDLQQRGFILAVCSKNNEADFDEVLRDHPHQLLRHAHFAARRVNWLPKAENLRALADELNLGLESFIFVDDSEHECLAVRQALPQVEVVRVPAEPLAIPGCLDRIARLEIVALTDEDRAKTQMYAEERQRRELERSVAQGGGDIGSYLRSLDMQMSIGIDDARHIVRLAQLTQKTNQFNLTTRRYSEEQVRGFVESDLVTVAHFSLADRFGNSGVVGLAILRHSPADKTAALDTFLMSCRVIGRSAESAFLEALLRMASERGAETIVGEFIPTAKNVLVKEFLPSHGFEPAPDGTWRRSLAQRPPRDPAEFPIAVKLEREADRPAALFAEAKP